VGDGAGGPQIPLWGPSITYSVYFISAYLYILCNNWPLATPTVTSFLGPCTPLPSVTIPTIPMQIFWEPVIIHDNRGTLRCDVACGAGLVEVMWKRDSYTALLNAVLLAKCIHAHIWENSHFVSKQLTGIGQSHSSINGVAVWNSLSSDTMDVLGSSI